MLKSLKQHLANQNWQSADQETSRIIKQLHQNAVSDARNSAGIQHSYDWQQAFHEQAQPLLTHIDSLWRKYSNNRFGFSVQAEIWFNSSLAPSQLFQWNKFIFSLEACPGHLPTISHMDCVERWSEYDYQEDRLFTLEITLFGKTWDNTSTRTFHERRIWFGELLLCEFEPEFHQVQHTPTGFQFAPRFSTVTLVEPERRSTQPEPSWDTGFPIKRIIFWGAIAVWLFSLPPFPPDYNLFVDDSMMLFLLVSLLFFAGLSQPKSVFLFGKCQTKEVAFETYTPLVFISMLLGAAISLYRY
jgi:hypothetical protein